MKNFLNLYSFFIPKVTEVFIMKGVNRIGSIQKKIIDTNLQRELGFGEKGCSDLVCKSGDWSRVPL
jgi:hypothetical protein